MRFLILLILSFLAVAEASAETRIALVIGNGAYPSIGSLPNPTADAQLISRTLTELEFETTLLVDSNQSSMKQEIANFGRKLRNAGKDAVGLFYFAGHGVQAQGRNYLLPIEANPADQADLDLMGVEANWILRQMESAGNRTNILILDACRNNPFVSTSRSLSRGLAQIDAPTGSFISYATAPGKVALDGNSVNSPFTTALANALPKAGLAIEQVFKQVRVDVIRATGGAQTPWDSSSLVSDFYFKTPAAKPATISAETTPVELSLWQSVSATGDADRIALFLQVFPNSKFAAQARQLLSDALTQDIASSTSAGTRTNSVNGNTTANGTGSNPIELTNTDREFKGDSVDTKSELTEHELISRAQSTGSISDFQEYINRYPDGVFVDLAEAAIAYRKQIAMASEANTSAPAEPVRKETVPTSLLFDSPLPEDTEVDLPRSIRQLSQAIPAVPPVEGLDPEYWAEQHCSNCHNWTQENLCRQGTFYTTSGDAAIDRISHPFRGLFKRALKRWANEGCQ